MSFKLGESLISLCCSFVLQAPLMINFFRDYQVLQFEEQQKQKEASFEEAILKNKKSLINFALP